MTGFEKSCEWTGELQENGCYHSQQWHGGCVRKEASKKVGARKKSPGNVGVDVFLAVLTCMVVMCYRARVPCHCPCSPGRLGH
jgi:hypothetical protein